MVEKLERIRAAIDEINRRLVDAISERGRLVEQVATLKTNEGKEMIDPQREHEMLQGIIRLNKGPFSDDALASIFRKVFARSRELVLDSGMTRLQVLRKNGDPDRVIHVRDVAIGGDRLEYIAGPCAVESEEMLDDVASQLSAVGVRLLRGGAFKPRTSPYAFQGLGEPGLQVLRRVADRYGMSVVTEVMDTRDVDLVASYADMLQVGARNMYSYPLLKELGRVGKPILLKRSFSATIQEWLLAAEYIVSHGNPNVVLCERGIRTFEHETRNTLDLAAVPVLRRRTYLPVVVDVSHAAGRRDILAELAAAAFAAGTSCVMIEVHPMPAAAASDGPQQLRPADFLALMQEVRHRLTRRLPPAPTA